jgi:hypothetical protein
MYIGQLCTPTKEALDEIKMRTQADGEWFDNPTPLPVIGIHPIHGGAMLAFPFWWWKEGELIEVE